MLAGWVGNMNMSAKHIIPGLDDPTCGIAVAAKQLIARCIGEDGEIWVHSMWSPMVIRASFSALLTGKRLVRMPHGCTDPTKLKFHWHKKRWVAPIERWLFRRADRIIATCEEEINWIKMFEPKVKKIVDRIVPAQSGKRVTTDFQGRAYMFYMFYTAKTSLCWSIASVEGRHISP